MSASLFGDLSELTILKHARILNKPDSLPDTICLYDLNLFLFYAVAVLGVPFPTAFVHGFVCMLYHRAITFNLIIDKVARVFEIVFRQVNADTLVLVNHSLDCQVTFSMPLIFKEVSSVDMSIALSQLTVAVVLP